MLDDELLPKNHPLQLYLEELELSEKDIDADDRKVQIAPTTRFLSGRNAVKQFARALSFIHPRLFGLAEHFRQHILENASDYITPADAAVMRHMYHATYDPKYMRTSLFALSLGFMLPLSFLMTHTNRLMALLGFILVLPAIAVILSAVHLHMIHVLLRKCTTQMKLVQLRLRSSLGFLQEFDHHSSFGVSHLSLLNQTAWSYPILQKQLGRSLRFYNDLLIESSLDLNGQISLLSDDFCCGLSTVELKPLKERLCSEDLTYVLRELKMLREVSSLLESDLINKVMGSICVVPIQSLLFWIRLTMLLRSLLCGLNGLQQPLNKLERLCDYLQNGDAESSDSETQSTGAAETLEHGRSQLLTSADRLTRALLMHLLVAVKSTRELSKLIGRHCAEDEVPGEWKATLEHLRCQLDACNNAREELDKLLYPDGSSPSEPYLDESDDRQQAFTFKSMEEATPRKTIKAEDIDPEDDVLEDVAVGESSTEENESKVNNELEEDVIPIVPLHSSVLKELRTAIAYRRLTMQEREQRALRKRTQAIQSHDQVKSCLLEKSSGSCSEALCMSHAEPLAAPVHQNGSASVERKSISEFPDGDSALDSFFSESILDNTSVAPEQAHRELRRRYSWKAQSAVEKRTKQFRRANTVLPSSHCPASINGTPLISPRLVVPPSRVPLPGMVPVPFVPANPGAQLPMRPFLTGSSLASALLAQRRKAGYKEEESFVAVGTGEELLPEVLLPEDAHAQNDHVQP